LWRQRILHHFAKILFDPCFAGSATIFLGHDISGTCDHDSLAEFERTMANPDSLALAANAGAEGLETVLVGGNAINLHAYFRTTFDVDLLVRETDVERWVSYFQERGYAVFNRSPNFIRLRSAPDPAAALPIDLMLADEQTFEKILAQSNPCDIGNGLSLAIPSPLHLIAMKLHELRNPGRLEHGVDLLDVKHLIKTSKIDTSSKEFIEIVDRHATDAVRARILQELKGDAGS
jgi:hypothetical protein